jgi:two-component system response regulator AtoC
VDVRVLAATNRDLSQEVSQGKFREDLFYRLNVVALKLPPLRDRPEELPALAERFIAQHASRLGIPRKDISSEALVLMQEWRWPGNVRELENALERALVLSDGDEIGPDALPEEMRAAHRASGPPPTPLEGDLSVKRAQRALEADLIRRALERTGGNRSRAAELLELSPRALLYKIREYGLGE